jgi:DnaJ-class molecular chaperone
LRLRALADLDNMRKRCAAQVSRAGFSFSEDDIDLDDLLGGLFGGRGQRTGRAGRGWGPIPGADQEAELELTVEEAYRGTRRNITLTTSDRGRRSIEVTVPAGVTDGQRIRIAVLEAALRTHRQPGR